jgi:hypothetical protein
VLDFIRTLFKKEQPKQQVRVCNNCGTIWQVAEDPTGKTSYGVRLCPSCLGIDTEMATDWHRTNGDRIKEWHEQYLEAVDKKEEIRQSA